MKKEINIEPSIISKEKKEININSEPKQKEKKEIIIEPLTNPKD